MNNKQIKDLPMRGSNIKKEKKEKKTVFCKRTFNLDLTRFGESSE